jgi:hypothetical protein
MFLAGQLVLVWIVVQLLKLKNLDLPLLSYHLVTRVRDVESALALASLLYVKLLFYIEHQIQYTSKRRRYNMLLKQILTF